jgi:hypothetical protein
MIGAASVKVLPHHGMEGAKERGRPINNKLLLFFLWNCSRAGQQYQERLSALEKQDETNVLLSCRNSPGRKKPSADRILSADGRSTFDNLAPYQGVLACRAP